MNGRELVQQSHQECKLSIYYKTSRFTGLFHELLRHNVSMRNSISQIGPRIKRWLEHVYDHGMRLWYMKTEPTLLVVIDDRADNQHVQIGC